MGDAAGRTLWQNDAADRLFAALQPPALGADAPTGGWSHYFTAECVRRILAVDDLGSLEVELQTNGPRPLRQTCIIVDVSSGDPDSRLLLLILRAAPLSPAAAGAFGPDELAGVAHDLRSPVGAIFGYADALLDTDGGAGLSAGQRELLHRVRGAAARAVNMIKNLQQIFYLQAGKLHAPEMPTDLNAVVHEIAEAARFESEQACRLQLQLCPEPLPAPLEPTQLDRIVANLIANACKYSAPGSLIFIKTWRRQDRAYFEVTNSGSPIPAHELRSIFNRYQRGSSRGHSSGTGLGLFIVKSLVDAIGGTVSASSDGQDGAVFTVVLPLAGR
jgi:nitrogen-specific signal transduction histidine kinase